MRWELSPLRIAARIRIRCSEINWFKTSDSLFKPFDFLSFHPFIFALLFFTYFLDIEVKVSLQRFWKIQKIKFNPREVVRVSILLPSIQAFFFLFKVTLHLSLFKLLSPCEHENTQLVITLNTMSFATAVIWHALSLRDWSPLKIPTDIFQKSTPIALYISLNP